MGQLLCQPILVTISILQRSWYQLPTKESNQESNKFPQLRSAIQYMNAIPWKSNSECNNKVHSYSLLILCCTYHKLYSISICWILLNMLKVFLIKRNGAHLENIARIKHLYAKLCIKTCYSQNLHNKIF